MSLESQPLGQGEGGKEAGRSKEKSAFGAIGDMLMKKLTDAWNVENQEDSSRGEDNRNDKEPGRGRHERGISGAAAICYSVVVTSKAANL